MPEPISGTVAFFKAMAPVLTANVLAVTRVAKGRFTYLRLLVLVFLLMLCGLYVWGVYPPEASPSFPHVREMLAKWGLMGLHEHEQIEAKLGIKISKVEIRHRDATGDLLECGARLERLDGDLRLRLCKDWS
jgi:hypothetical protein